MAKGNIKVLFDLEPIMKIKCTETQCRFNLYDDGYYACNLKLITVGPGGRCTSFDRSPEEKGGKK